MQNLLATLTTNTHQIKVIDMEKKNSLPVKTFNKEIMKNYSFEELKRKGTIKLCLGEILTLKNIAIMKGFDEVADKLRVAENKILGK